MAWIKIARAAGMGAQAVRLVATDGRGRMCVQALRGQLDHDLAAGFQPVMLAATAGTTNAGEIDPLGPCRAIADEYALHLHVDAAWAGGLIVDSGRKHLLQGIEHADSVTIDAHKWLSVPMGAGMVFVREAKAVAEAFAVHTGYMPAGDGQDAYITSKQWSRRFLGLRLWMMLRATGPGAYEEMFAQQFAAAQFLRKELPKRGWTIHSHSPLPLILFEDARSALSSQEVSDALEQEGTVWLVCVLYEERSLLRACLTGFLTEALDVNLLLERLDEARSSLASAKGS